MPNLTMPVPMPAYQRDEESQFRSQLNQALQSLAASRMLAVIPGTPSSIPNQSWWLEIDESTQAVTLFYQDSAGAQHTLALGNYV